VSFIGPIELIQRHAATEHRQFVVDPLADVDDVLELRVPMPNSPARRFSVDWPCSVFDRPSRSVTIAASEPTLIAEKTELPPPSSGLLMTRSRQVNEPRTCQYPPVRQVVVVGPCLGRGDLLRHRAQLGVDLP
jgi:hypothetical protein